MRETRDVLSAEIESMSYEELIQWLRSHHYSDPVLRQLSARAVHQEVSSRRPAGQ